MIQLVNVEGAQLFYSRELYCSAFLTQWLKYFTVDFISGAEAYSELGDNPTVCSQETVNVFYKNLQTSLPFKTVKIDKLYENILNWLTVEEKIKFFLSMFSCHIKKTNFVYVVCASEYSIQIAV